MSQEPREETALGVSNDQLLQMSPEAQIKARLRRAVEVSNVEVVGDRDNKPVCVITGTKA